MKIIGYWKLDELTGFTAEDSTSNGNDGTVVGTAIEPGLLGQARYFFPNSADRVEIGNQSIFNFTNNEFTLAAWVRTPASPSGDIGIITKRDDTSNNISYSLVLDSNANVDFSASSDGSSDSSQVSSGLPINDDQWHLITVTRSDQEYKLYIDATEVDSNSSGIANIYSSTAPFAIGNFSSSSSWDSSFDGYIDDVKVFDYALSAAEVNDLFYNSPFDAFPPIFFPINPQDGDQGVLVETPIEFIYSDENPKLDTLNFTVNDFPIIENGLVTTDGYVVTYELYSEALSDGYDGYKVTVEFLDGLIERSTINVEIDAADAYGSFTSFTYSFGTASSVDPAPVFVNFNPLPFSSGHGPNDPIAFQFNDGYEIGPDLVSGANLSSLQVRIDNEQVVKNGVIQPGFGGSITPNAFDGFDVNLTKNGGWRPGRNLYVILYGEDNNGSSVEENYFIRMGGGPVAQNPDPGDGYIEVQRDTDISFEIADAIFGVNNGSLQLFIDDILAVDNGVAQPGYTVAYDIIEDGYIVSVTLPTLPEYTDVELDITVTNGVLETKQTLFTFQTVDETPPVFQPFTPTDSSLRVDPFAQIIFDALDGYSGPDAYSIDVTINNELVVSDGYATSGYEVNFDPIDDGFRVRVIADGGWPEFTALDILVEGSDLQGNFGTLSYFVSIDDISGPVVTDLDPDNGEQAFAATDVIFSIHDSGGVGVLPELLNVTVDGFPAITGGLFQPGYTGSISPTTSEGFDGYEVVIDPDNDFTLDTTIAVEVDTKDAYGNQTVFNYSFVVNDETAPVITNLDPAPGSTSSLRPFIRFRIHDSGGVGVDSNLLQMTVDGVPAIVNGNIAPNFSGLVDPTLVNGFDGYNIFVRWNNYFQQGTEHFVVIDGYDGVGNFAQASYSFFATQDDVSPFFENFNPEPGETGVPLDSAIAFDFNDPDGYLGGTNIFTLNAVIDGTQAVVNGEGVNGYNIVFEANNNDGYSVEIFPPSLLPEFQDILVELDGYDESDLFASFSYSFRASDITPPDIIPVSPLPGETNVGPTEDIILNITDGYSGIDLDTLNVVIDGTNAIVGGIIQDGYELNINGILDGYSLEITNSQFAEGRTANIFVSVEDIENNYSQIEYSFSVADITGPDFDSIVPAPFSIDVANHVNLSFDFIDFGSGADLSTLGITIDGDVVVSNGNPAPGFQLETIPIASGFSVELKELVFFEGEEKEITLDGYDNSGNYSSLNFFLTGAFVRPQFSNFIPAPDSVSVPVDTDIEFDVTDAYGIDIDEIEIFINGFPAVISGQALDGYDVTYAPITDGYRVTLELQEELPKFTNIPVDLFARDKNGVEGEFLYEFLTVSDFPPDFLFITPAPSSVDQNEEQNITFTIEDPAGNGIVLSSIDVYVNFQPVILSGGVQDGYSAEIIAFEDGYNIEIEHEPFEPFSRVFVSIAATTIDGNSGYLEYFYDVGKKGPPQLIPIDPLEGEINVPTNTDIVFEVRDLFGVDLTGLTVTIDGAPAFRDSSFIFPFTGGNSDIEEITDDEFRSFPDLQPVFSPAGTFFPPEPFTEIIFIDTDDDFDGYIDGYVQIDGYTDGYFVPDGYFLDGYFDDGYDGYIPVANVGYRFTFDRLLDYQFNSIIAVEVHVADLEGNEGDRSYAFTIEKDVGPPAFENVSPIPSEINVELDRIFEFDFIDTGSGALLSSLNVSFGSAQAIVGGEFQDGYSGFTEYFTDSYGDGYHVEVFPNVGWPNSSEIIVSLFGEDFVGNSAQFDFSFFTEDVQGPVFENIFPAPGAVDVPTDTAIRFEFNDKSQTGADLSTLDIRILGSLVVIDGYAQDGYVLEATANDKDGYDIQLFLPGRLPEFQPIDIVLYGNDLAGNFSFFEYSWTTADETGPVFDRLIPSFSDDKITGTGPIYADILDYHSGVDFDSIGITIDGVSYVDSGIVQPTGFVVEFQEIEDGYRFYAESIGPLPHEITPDTTALWRMDSDTGTIPEATGKTLLDATVFGATSVPGKFSNALSFDGVNDRLQISAQPDLQLQSFTVEAWINPSVLSSESVIYAYIPRQTISASRGVIFKVTSSGALSLELGDGIIPFSPIISSPGDVLTGTYSHVAARVDSSENSAELFVNGERVQNTSLPVSFIEYDDGPSGSPVSSRVFIGARISPFSGAITGFFNGVIDDLKVSDGPLDRSTIVNSYNRGEPSFFAEFETVDVDLFAVDNVGNDGYISYFFTTLDETPPVFSNFDPFQGEVQVDINADIEFDFTDIHSGPDLDTLRVTVDGRVVVEDGIGIDSFIDTSAIVDGYRVTIDLDYPLPEFKNIVVVLDGYDIDPNQTIFTYQFSTDDISEPVLENELPEDGSVQVNPFTDIVFDIHDTNGSGLVLDSLYIEVDDRPVLIKGVAQEDWVVTITPTFVDGYDGYNFIIEPDRRFALDSDIRVFVDGYDAYGNQLFADFSFRTFDDEEPPEIVNLVPAPFDVEVSLNSSIRFDIIDGYDVDISRLDVHVDNDPAILDGQFQIGYEGPSSGISEIQDGYTVEIDPQINFFYNQQVTVVIDGYDFSDNQVNFVYYFNTIADVFGPTISNRNPDNLEVEVALDSDVTFEITDTISGVDLSRLDVHIDSIPAILDGEFLPGYDGASSGIETILDGYRVVIDGYQFDYNQIIAVTIDGYDFADNHTNNVYWFATIADTNGPALSNFDPLPGEVEVPVNTNISFDITDDVSGVDLDKLDVFVNDVPAILDGIIRDPWSDPNSGIEPITDGYRIILDQFVNFDFDELQEVFIDGYDFAQNNTQFTYTFLTKVDIDGPTIIPINPVDTQGDVPRSPNIQLRVLDFETGVDFSRFDLTIDNVQAIDEGEFVVGSGFDGPFSKIVQRLDGYDIFIDTTITYDPSQLIKVVADGYDIVGNQTHFEYTFSIIDDEGPIVFDFSPEPNSVDAEGEPLHVSFGIRDRGDGEVDLSTLKIEASQNADEPFITIYEPVDEFQNGWTGSISNQPDGDGYVLDLFKTEQAETFALFTFKITAADNRSNISVNEIGKTGGLIDTGTGTVTGFNTIDVGEFFINSNQIEPGDLAIIKGVGAAVVDGYNTDEIIFDRQIAAGGTVDVNIYRGSFLTERRIFRPQLAEATSLTTVDVTFSDPPVIGGTELSPGAYTITGGDYPINVVSVDQLDLDTFELTLDVPMQSEPTLYTLTVDSVGITNAFGFTIDDGYESIDYLGFPDIFAPRFVTATNAPFNVNITVIFDDFMTQDSDITNPNNYLVSDGAFVTKVEADPTELDRVVLTVERLFGQPTFEVFINGNIKDKALNVIDPEYRQNIVNLQPSTAALSGVAGRVKSRNAVRRLFEDSSNWYLATSGGIDVVSKLELENLGYVLDGYGYNAITADTEDIYFGRSDGYMEDGYGVRRLPFVNLNKDSSERVQDAFSIYTTPAILSNEINDLFVVTNASDRFLAVGTAAGATLIKNSNSAVNYSDGYDIVSVQMNDSGDTLYLANNTLGRVEVYYNTHLDISDRANPDFYYDVSTSPEISDSNINQIKITNNTSIIDEVSNSIYVATDNGLAVIHTNESTPGSSETGGISLTYGIVGSGANYEILGGQVNRVVAVDVNLQVQQAFVATNDPSRNGGVTTINLPSNTQFQFASQEKGTLVNNDIRDVTVKNL